MRESKMYKMQLIVEHKYITEDSETRIYLSKVRESKWPAVKRICKKLISTIHQLLLAAIVTLPFGIWSIRYAYHERGYKAYGGEYLFMVLVYYMTLKVLNILFERKG